MTGTALRRLILVGLAAALIVFEEVVGYHGDAAWALTRTLAHAMAGLSYVVCAWLAWQSADSPMPGRIMIAIAFLWLPPPFVAATWHLGALWPLLESLGLFWAILQAALVSLYPTGRFHGTAERVLLSIGAGAGLLRMLAVILTDPAPAEDCACAPNAYAILPNAELYDLVDRGFRFLGISLIIGVIVVVGARWLRGSTPARNIAFVMPVALIAWCTAISYETVAYALGVPPAILAVYIGYLATASIPISFVAGLIFIRSLRGRVSDLMVLTRDGVDRSYWQLVLAETLRDPQLKVYWWDKDAGVYVDAAGVVMPGEPDRTRPRGRALMEITSSIGRLALIDHDKALAENRELLDATSTAMTLSVDNGRLRSELELTLEEVRESRVRIIEAALTARRQIERDLHDGSQQSLVSLALSMRMAVSHARASGDEALAAELEDALGQLTEALRQLRELARGIHPSSLSIGGLALAIGELTSRSPVPVEVTFDIDERLPPLTESTIYFFVSECLTNIAKYAAASRARITVEPSGDGLRICVSDDGIGGADMEAGSGIIGLSDRIQAIGGTIELASTRGQGTIVTALIPASALS